MDIEFQCFSSVFLDKTYGVSQILSCLCSMFVLRSTMLYYSVAFAATEYQFSITVLVQNIILLPRSLGYCKVLSGSTEKYEHVQKPRSIRLSLRGT